MQKNMPKVKLEVSSKSEAEIAAKLNVESQWKLKWTSLAAATIFGTSAPAVSLP